MERYLKAMQAWMEEKNANINQTNEIYRYIFYLKIVIYREVEMQSFFDSFCTLKQINTHKLFQKPTGKKSSYCYSFVASMPFA